MFLIFSDSSGRLFVLSLSSTCCLSLLHMAQVPFGCLGGSSLNCNLTGHLL